jgi:hypothetical protein
MTLFYPHKLNEDLDVPFKFGDVGIWIMPSLTETRRKSRRSSLQRAKN